MKKIFLSNDSLPVQTFEKEIISLCESAESLISKISYMFLNNGIKFLSSNTSTKQLTSVLNNLRKYANEANKLHYSASYTQKKFSNVEILAYPEDNTRFVVRTLWKASANIPEWIDNINHLTKDIENISVDNVQKSLNNTINSIFGTFSKINELLSQVKFTGSRPNTLPTTIGQCPRISGSE